MYNVAHKLTRKYGNLFSRSYLLGMESFVFPQIVANPLKKRQKSLSEVKILLFLPSRNFEKRFWEFPAKSNEQLTGEDVKVVHCKGE